MKCEELLPALEMGRFWQRWQARRHARRCPECQRLLASWQTLRTALNRPETVSQSQRELWNGSAPEVSLPARVLPQWGWAIASLVLVTGATIILWPRQRANRPEVVHQVSPVEISFPSPERIDPAFRSFEQQLHAFEVELDHLIQVAESSEAERNLAQLIQEHSKRGP
jgi:hypothetical protein